MRGLGCRRARAGEQRASWAGDAWPERGRKKGKPWLGWAGVEGNGPGCGPWGKGKVGQRFGLPTGFGLVSLFFF